MSYADEALHSRLIEEQRRLWIDTLSHARHDWLNELQLIMGYVQLRKYDKLAECVEMLKRRMAEEGRMSKLGAPGLIEALLTYRTKTKPYAFSVQVTENPDFGVEADRADTAEYVVRRLLSAFEAAAEKGELGTDNTLVCTFAGERSGTGIHFTYQGAYVPGPLRKAVSEVRSGLKARAPACVLSAAYGADQAKIKVKLPAGE